MARVLVAEDEVLIRVDIVETLEEGGHTVVGEAGDGEQALQLARELAPELVIMDVKMPKLDGVEAATRIVQESAGAVLVLTAFSDKELVERAAEHRDLKESVEDLEAKLAARKVIERAKGKLMEQFGLTEEQAFVRMRRAAMDRQLPLAEIARRVLESTTQSQPQAPPQPSGPAQR